MPVHSSHRLALPPGACVRQRYRVERLLGKGGFAFTYLASDLKLNRRVALKELFLDQAVTRQGNKVVPASNSREDQAVWQWALRKFKEEAQHLARFRRHPNIVSVNDLVTENQTAYIVMNYVDGHSLDEHLRALKRTLTARELQPIFFQVLNGLHAVHSKNVLHRDIKPSNIYLTQRGQVILLDFGAARLDSRLTSGVSTLVPHSHGYSPLEQYRRMPPSPASDIYSTAATLVRVITGGVPPHAEQRTDADAYIPVSMCCAGKYPPAFLRLVDAGMAVYPTQRPHSIEAWRLMLQSESPRPSVRPGPPPSPPPPLADRRRPILAALAAMLLVLVLIALSLVVTRHWHGPGETALQAELRAVLEQTAPTQRHYEELRKAGPKPEQANVPGTTPAPGPARPPAFVQSTPPATVSTTPPAPGSPAPSEASSSSTPAPDDALAQVLSDFAKDDLENGVRPENYAAKVSVNDTGNPRDLESKTRAQLVSDEAKDNAAYENSVFIHLVSRLLNYDASQDTATLREFFIYDRVLKANGLRKLGLVTRELHFLDAGAANRCIDGRIVKDRTLGYCCRLSAADHLDSAGKPLINPKTKQTYASVIREVLYQDRANFQNVRLRDPEDMEFSMYAAPAARAMIRQLPSDGILVWPKEEKSLVRLVRGDPVVFVFPETDNSAIVIYMTD